MTIVLCDNCGQRVESIVRSKSGSEFCTIVCLIAKVGPKEWSCK